MNRTTIALLILAASVSSTPSFAMDRDTLWSMLTFSDTPALTDSAGKAARQNPSLLEEILMLPDMQRDNGVARQNSLVWLRECSLDGVITEDRYFADVLRLLNQINTLVVPKQVARVRNNILGTLSSYGRDEHTPITQNFATFPTMANSLSSNGLIKNNGLLNSLTSKINNAKEIFDKKGPDAKGAAINKINAAINECDAQRGKHITEDGYQIVTGYCTNLIAKIQRAK